MSVLTPEYCLKVFGDPKKAEAKWCVIWNAPKDITTCIPTIPKRIYMNKVVIPYWTVVYRELCEKKLGHLIKTWDGWFNIRKQRGSDKWSIHSWGLGLDINASTNPQGKKPTMDPRIVKVFEDNGFIWGGRFKGSRVDGMHYELSKEMVDDYFKTKTQ